MQYNKYNKMQYDMLHDIMWHNITQHHVTSNPKNVVFLDSPMYASQAVQEMKPVGSPHQSRNLLFSLKDFWQRLSLLCDALFITASALPLWQLNGASTLGFCLSGTERKCTVQDIDTLFRPFLITYHSRGPTVAHPGPTHYKVRDFHSTDLRSIPIAGKRFSCTRIRPDSLEGQTEHYLMDTGGVADEEVARMWSWPLTSI